MIDSIRVELITDGSGNAAGVVANVSGKLLAVHVVLGTSTTPDVTIKDSLGHTLFAETGMGTGDRRYPRDVVDSIAGVALTYDGTRTVHEAQPFLGGLDIAIANGGNTDKTLSIILAWET